MVTVLSKNETPCVCNQKSDGVCLAVVLKDIVQTTLKMVGRLESGDITSPQALIDVNKVGSAHMGVEFCEDFGFHSQVVSPVHTFFKDPPSCDTNDSESRIYQAWSLRYKLDDMKYYRSSEYESLESRTTHIKRYLEQMFSGSTYPCVVVVRMCLLVDPNFARLVGYEPEKLYIITAKLR